MFVPPRCIQWVAEIPPITPMLYWASAQGSCLFGNGLANWALTLPLMMSSERRTIWVNLFMVYVVYLVGRICNVSMLLVMTWPGTGCVPALSSASKVV